MLHLLDEYVDDVALYMHLLLGLSRDPKKGAATTLYAAVHPDLNKEEFQHYSDCKATPSSTASRYVCVCVCMCGFCLCVCLVCVFVGTYVGVRAYMCVSLYSTYACMYIYITVY